MDTTVGGEEENRGDDPEVAGASAGLCLRASGNPVLAFEPNLGLEAGSSAFPSLHYRKEGWLPYQENIAKPPKLTQPGWFSLCSHRKTTPASRSAEASQ